MTVIPFPLDAPLAVVSIAANWTIEGFASGDSRPVGTMRFAMRDQVVPALVDLRLGGWRIAFSDGCAGVRKLADAAFWAEATR